LAKIKLSLGSAIEHIILFGLFGTLLLPSVSIGVGINLMTPCAFLLLVFIFFAIVKGEKLKINRFFVLYIIILLIMNISILHSYVALSVPPTYRDYMELFRYAQVLPYLLVIPLVRYDTFERKSVKYFNVSIVLVTLISLIQITNLFNLGYHIGLIYSGPIHASYMVTGSHRIIVTGTDPNVGGVIAAFFLTYAISKLIAIRSTYNFLQVFALFTVILMTQSRTVLVGGSIVVILSGLFFARINILLKCFFITSIGVALYNIILFLNLDYITIGFQTMLEGKNNSVNVRVENLLLAWERFLSSPYVGWGPAKMIHSTSVDSEYVLIFQRYGLLGLIAFVSYIAVILFSSVKLHNKYRNFSLFPLMTFLYMCLGAVVMLTNNFFAGYQLSASIVLLLILIVSFSTKMSSQSFLCRNAV